MRIRILEWSMLLGLLAGGLVSCKSGERGGTTSKGCQDGGVPQDKVQIDLPLKTEFYACVKPDGIVQFKPDDNRSHQVCFPSSPFIAGGGKQEITMEQTIGNLPEKKVDSQAAAKSYEFYVVKSTDKCPSQGPDGGSGETKNGTLEVATGGTGEPPPQR